MLGGAIWMVANKTEENDKSPRKQQIPLKSTRYIIRSDITK